MRADRVAQKRGAQRRSAVEQRRDRLPGQPLVLKAKGFGEDSESTALASTRRQRAAVHGDLYPIAELVDPILRPTGSSDRLTRNQLAAHLLGPVINLSQLPELVWAIVLRPDLQGRAQLVARPRDVDDKRPAGLQIREFALDYRPARRYLHKLP
jgi:hypothetical protein